MNTPEPYMTYKQAAGYIGCSVSALYTLVSRRKIPCHRHGRIVRFRASEIDAWLHLCEAA